MLRQLVFINFEYLSEVFQQKILESEFLFH